MIDSPIPPAQLAALGLFRTVPTGSIRKFRAHPSGFPSMSAVPTTSIDSAAPQLHPSGYGPSRSLPSGSIVEDLQAALAQIRRHRIRSALRLIGVGVPVHSRISI